MLARLLQWAGAGVAVVLFCWSSPLPCARSCSSHRICSQSCFSASPFPFDGIADGLWLTLFGLMLEWCLLFHWELSLVWKESSWISTGGVFVTCNKLFCDCEPCAWLKCKRKLVGHLAFVRVRLSFLLSWLEFHEFWVNLSWVTFWLG